MTNTYRAVSVAAKSQYGEDPVELDLSVMDEKDALDNGQLELVPRKYRVLTDNFSGGPEGSVYDAAFRREIEAALLGVHIERYDETDEADAPAEDAPPADAPPQDSPQDATAQDAPADKPAAPAADKKGK